MSNYLSGTISINEVEYVAAAIYDQGYVEIRLVNGNTREYFSAYKFVNYADEYSYKTKDAKAIYNFIKIGESKCNKKNASNDFIKGIGAVVRHTIRVSESFWEITKGNNLIVACEAYGITKEGQIKVSLKHCDKIPFSDLDYVKLTTFTKPNNKVVSIGDYTINNDFEETVPVRSLAEISLEKDTTWLKDKHYFIVNNEANAEEFFKRLDNYNGLISYDTETTGLCINMFGQVGSEKKALIEKENAKLIEEGKQPYKVDRLVGIIFCIQENVSFYFPCFNRKFKNLYEDRESEITKTTINNILAKYTVGELRDAQTPMAKYIRETPSSEWTNDVILMERCRNILETKRIGAHHGSFEYKVGLMYSIDTNLVDDSMLLHQLLYKFRNPKAGDRGEPSNLKYLTKVEFGIDQLDLKDFFVNYKEDNSKSARAVGRNGSRIDFSYMDYDGSRAYAPADGDFTYGLIKKYRHGLATEFKKQEYLYQVEVLVSCAIGYMEFNGHRLDERRIEATKVNTYVHMMTVEKKIRDLINANTEAELAAFKKLEEARDILANISDEYFKNRTDKELEAKYEEAINLVSSNVTNLQEMFAKSENQINLGSPQQVAELFYDRLQIPVGKDGKKSVDKRAVKPLAKAMNEDMTPKYPVVKLYQDWKNDSTLLTKFFDNLPSFMYPGGFIFSGYGQIATATGRMSCSGPNAQQYPHSVTCMVIPRDNCVFVDADYSQIEYRTLTALAKEDSLMQKFKDPDMDYHTTMASLMYDTPYANVTGQMRSEAKTFNFGIPYGMGLKKLAFQLKGREDESAVAEAKEKYELYFKEQPHVRQFFDDVKEKARIYNYTETNWGRRRYYSFTDADGNFDQRKMASALRQAGNAVIQGCLDGDTLIETKDMGIIPIKDAVGYSGLVWNGTDWTHGDVLYSGKKQKCIITFTNGQKFICSPIHRFKVVPETVDGFQTINPHWKNDVKVDGFIGGYFVRCEDLKVGQAICINEQSHLLIEDYDNRNHNLTCVDACDDDSGNTYEYEDKIPCVIVESVEITDEYIDMYDVCNTDCGYYVADGIITHNTAADIFKIGVARNFLFLRNNKLFGKYFITNMVHDEQLVEIDASVLNVKRLLAALIQSMELHMEGFPPLYVGAGVGASWDEAKGKMAEIHPLLGRMYVAECAEEKMGIYAEKPQSPEEVYAYFKDRNFKFRENKILDYVTNPDNYGKTLHPVIGSLLGLQFDYGVSKELKERFSGKEGIDYTKEEKDAAEKYSPMERLARFIKAHNLDIPITNFQEVHLEEEKPEENDGYDDYDGDFEDGLVDNGIEADDADDYKLINEDNVEYGVKIVDLIRTFDYVYSKSKHLLGLNWAKFPEAKRNKIINLLNTKKYTQGIDDDRDDVMVVKFLDVDSSLKPDNNTTQLLVAGVSEASIVKIINARD